MSASRSRRSYAEGFKDELCREVISTSKPIVDVAKSYGVGAELARLKELEKENQELRAENLFLKKASAYFAREQR